MAPIPQHARFLSTNPPPPTQYSILSFPAPHVLLVTLDRPRQLNCINTRGHAELHRVWAWFDAEPQLRVGIITGKGRAFCAGADLKEWSGRTESGKGDEQLEDQKAGFAGLSRRRGKKPILAAVNGLAHGGGCEMIVNCDLVFASADARFALPEVKRGVAAIAGALPRLVKVVGRMRAMEMALTGREIGALEAKSWGLCNDVCMREKESVVDLTIRWAQTIAENSPDSVIVSKAGIEMGVDGGMSVENASQRLLEGMWKQAEGAENMSEGLRAFVEKRKPNWVPSKL